MVNKYEELISGFEIKLRKLISEYRSLQDYSKQVELELEQKNEDLIKAHGVLLELRKENEHLSIANQISTNSSERSDAKKKIDSLVREIDQCLALLNE